MIIVDIMCGMGNQMFQYAFARSVQIKNKDKKLVFNMITARRMHDGRSYSLNHCRLTNNIIIYPVSFQFFIDAYLKIKMKFLSAIYSEKDNHEGKFYFLLKKGILSSDKIFKYYTVPLIKSNIKYINGWWQSPKYFSDIAQKLKVELKIVTPPSSENLKLINQIQSCESVCVHVRRGDYLSDKFSSELNICDEKYYKKAIDLINTKVKNAVFFIFSNSHDDIVWIKNNWNFPCNSVYVDLNNPDYEELRLMYSCKHFILANSTFSWWGAFLADNDKKNVIVPKVWNRRDLDYEDVYMEDWIRI